MAESCAVFFYRQTDIDNEKVRRGTINLQVVYGNVLPPQGDLVVGCMPHPHILLLQLPPWLPLDCFNQVVGVVKEAMVVLGMPTDCELEISTDGKRWLVTSFPSSRNPCPKWVEDGWRML